MDDANEKWTNQDAYDQGSFEHQEAQTPTGGGSTPLQDRTLSEEDVGINEPGMTGADADTDAGRERKGKGAPGGYSPTPTRKDVEETLA